MIVYAKENKLTKIIQGNALDRASDRLRKKKSNFAGFLGTNSLKNHPCFE